MDKVMYSEGAGAATWAVVILSLTAAAIAGRTWLRSLTTLDSIPVPGGAVPAAVAMLVGLVIGFIGIETLFRRKIVLTGKSLQVGRESVPLSQLALPVLAGDHVPESIRNASLSRNALPSGCKPLGDVPRAILGQGTLAVANSSTREILVVYTWRPQVLAYFLSRALESRGDDAADADHAF